MSRVVAFGNVSKMLVCFAPPQMTIRATNIGKISIDIAYGCITIVLK